MVMDRVAKHGVAGPASAPRKGKVLTRSDCFEVPIGTRVSASIKADYIDIGP